MIDTIELDATLSEEHNMSSQISSHPIEKGTDITDHIRPEPESLTIEGVISSTPTQLKHVLKFVDRTKRFDNAEKQLRELWQKAEPFTVVTSLRTYENMVIQTLSIPRDKDTTNIFRFKAQLRKVQLVSTEQLSDLADAVSDALSSPTDLGDQTGS